MPSDTVNYVADKHETCLLGFTWRNLPIKNLKSDKFGHCYHTMHYVPSTSEVCDGMRVLIVGNTVVGSDTGRKFSSDKIDIQEVRVFPSHVCWNYNPFVTRLSWHPGPRIGHCSVVCTHYLKI